jgi:hypothetical protein
MSQYLRETKLGAERVSNKNREISERPYQAFLPLPEKHHDR